MHRSIDSSCEGISTTASTWTRRQTISITVNADRFQVLERQRNSDGVIRARFAEGWTSEVLKDGTLVLELVSGSAPELKPALAATAPDAGAPQADSAQDAAIQKTEADRLAAEEHAAAERARIATEEEAHAQAQAKAARAADEAQAEAQRAAAAEQAAEASLEAELAEHTARGEAATSIVQQPEEVDCTRASVQAEADPESMAPTPRTGIGIHAGSVAAATIWGTEPELLRGLSPEPQFEASPRTTTPTESVSPRHERTASNPVEDLEAWLVISEQEAVDVQESELLSLEAYGWEEHWSEEEQLPFFYNPGRGETRWDKPTRKELQRMAAEDSRLDAHAAAEQRLQRLSAYRDQLKPDADVASTPRSTPPLRRSGAGGNKGAPRLTFSRAMTVQEVCAWVRSTEMSAVEEKFRAEEVDGEMLAFYAAKTDHTLLKQDIGVTAGRARALHSTLCAFVNGAAAAESDAAAIAAAEAAAAAEEARRKVEEQEMIKAEIQQATDSGEYHRLPALVAQLEPEGDMEKPWLLADGSHDPDFEGLE